MISILIVLALVEFAVILFLFKKNSIENNKVREKNQICRQKMKRSETLLFDAQETISDKNEEIILLNKKISDIRKELLESKCEVKKLQEENLAFSIEIQKLHKNNRKKEKRQ